MSNQPLPHPDIEQFASICALLDDGFCTREDVLAAEGLDEVGWQQMRATCLSLLAGGDFPELSQRFGQAYGSARQHRGYLVISDGEETASNSRPPMFDTEATAATAYPLAGPALPFKSPPLGTTAGLERAPCPEIRPAPRLVDPTERTVEVPSLAKPRGAPLPFGSPQSPTGRRQRFEHFDTQTGQRLETPRWVDEPTPR
jgi:hypothetical protein